MTVLKRSLSDREAVSALRRDIAWKVACGLRLDDEGFHPTVLVYWRARLQASVLGRAGMSTVMWDEQKRLAEALKDAVGLVDVELSGRVNIVAERRPILDDALDYDCQGVVLRGSLPTRVVAESTTLASLSAFRSWDVHGDPHVCGVWLNRRVAEKQFAFPPGTVLTALRVRTS